MGMSEHSTFLLGNQIFRALIAKRVFGKKVKVVAIKTSYKFVSTSRLFPCPYTIRRTTTA